MTNDLPVHELIVEPHAFGAPKKAIHALYEESQNPGDKCIAAWTIEYGALNRVVSLWERPSGNCLISGEPTASIDWLSPARIGWRLESHIAPRVELLSAPFLDLRMYGIKPSQKDEILPAFVENLPARERYSMCAGMWSARERGQDLMIHLWPYESFDQRIAVREKTFKDPEWLQYLIKASKAFSHLQAIQMIPFALPNTQSAKEDRS